MLRGSVLGVKPRPRHSADKWYLGEREPNLPAWKKPQIDYPEPILEPEIQSREMKEEEAVKREPGTTYDNLCFGLTAGDAIDVSDESESE